jgi:hypothetical protein
MGFMKERFIGECTRLICDIIEKCDESNIPGVLILLDFEKAFDNAIAEAQICNPHLVMI